MSRWDGMSDCVHCGHEARSHDLTTDQKRGCLRCYLARQRDVLSELCIDYLGATT